ncbi:hypothetical protein B5S32_g2875 [[Candida] boidinii]|nr:hypothetical protein B5S32_g2875 [[Candida] boidinii]
MNKNLLILPIIYFFISFSYSRSPTDSYAPGKVQCPSFIYDTEYNTPDRQGFTRRSNCLSESETEWIKERHKITDENLKWFLNLADMKDLNTDQFIDDLDRSINIGLAFSGGGYRAMLAAAGEISGLDNRTNGIMEYGLPILPAVSYISGLSGGSWFLCTLAYNNWTSVQEIIDTRNDHNPIWNLKYSIADPNSTIRILKLWWKLRKELHSKKSAGFKTSFTDSWGRALSRHMLPKSSNYGLSTLFSDIREYPVFKNHEMPFPLVVAVGRAPGTVIDSSTSTVFEFNPFELGSWDPSLRSFVDLKYIGTDLVGGFPNIGKNTCIAGLDNVGYIFGTSSSLFNLIAAGAKKRFNIWKIFGNFLSFIQDVFDRKSKDIADYQPNPFYKTKWANSSLSIVNNHFLHLVDGGEDSQNIPLHPLIQKERQMDVIFAYDNSMDSSDHWPNGYSIHETYQRQFSNQGKGTVFPKIPTNTTFEGLGLNKRPTFFGCYAKDLTDLMENVDHDELPPLVIYMPNSYHSYNSNTSTFKLTYDTDEMLGMFRNGFEVSTRKNLTLDDEWRACVGCAILQRSKEKQGLKIGDQCQKCFDEYCWDGTAIVNTENKENVQVFKDYGMNIFGEDILTHDKAISKIFLNALHEDVDDNDIKIESKFTFTSISYFNDSISGIANKLYNILKKKFIH